MRDEAERHLVAHQGHMAGLTDRDRPHLVIHNYVSREELVGV